MANAPTIIDLGRLSLASGEGARIDLPLRLEPIELGGQSYSPTPQAGATARLDVSRPSGGYAFRLRFPLQLEGPCVRCLEAAVIEGAVDAREVDQPGSEDDELTSPYVSEGQLAVGRWAQDAAVLAAPTQVLCRPDCAGLCPVCGEPLNDADAADHDPGAGTDPRWDKLNELRGD